MPKNTSPIIYLAKAIAPKMAKPWLDEMAQELAFVKTKKLAWQIGMLNFAIKERFKSFSLRSPQSIAFASFAITAIVALAFVLPMKDSLFLNKKAEKPTTVDTESVAADSLKMQDSSLGQLASGKAKPSEVVELAKTSRNSASMADEQSNEGVGAVVAEALEALPAPAPAAGSARAATAPQSEGFGAATDTLSYSDKEIVFPRSVKTVEIKASEDTTLLLYKGEKPLADNLLIEKHLKAGEDLELELPFFLQTDDTSKVLIDGNQLSSLTDVTGISFVYAEDD